MDFRAAAKAYIFEKLEVKFIDDEKTLTLNKIVRAFFEMIPYQNISTSVLPPEERFPTEQVVLENGTSLKGGLNVHRNWFLKMLLEALGYNVGFVAARIESPSAIKPRIYGSHFAILIRDLEESGDLHLVDVGSGHPVFKAVPINDLPYTATDVNLTYRFFEKDGKWHMEHKDSEGDDNWSLFVSYEKTFEVGNPSDLFKDPVLDFLKEDWLVGGIKAIHYPQPGSMAIPDIPEFAKNYDSIVSINNDVLTIENRIRVVREEIIPANQTLSTIENYFPSIPKHEIEKKIKILYAGAARLMY